MPDKNLARWKELCEQVANEEDPIKLLKLVGEINLLLALKLDYLASRTSENPKT